MSRTGQVMTRIHRFAGLVFGAQVLIWIVSGLFFTLVPIEDVRGEHLRKPVVSPAIDVSELTLPASLGGEPVTGIRLASLLGKPAIELRTASGLALQDAATGEALPALDMDTAKAVAEARWAGRGVIASVELVDTAPREAGRGARPCGGPTLTAGTRRPSGFTRSVATLLPSGPITGACSTSSGVCTSWTGRAGRRSRPGG